MICLFDQLPTHEGSAWYDQVRRRQFLDQAIKSEKVHERRVMMMMMMHR
jgi:hypothetical protein